MSQPNYAIARGSRVLVTGANGYIASHIIDILLELGFNVRGTVRTEKPWLDRYFENKFGVGRFESTVVPAMEEESAFDKVMKDVVGLVHVASDLSMSPDPNSVIPRVIKGTLNALKAASKQESIKRFVLTSSSTAALIPKPNEQGVVIDQNTWNDAAVEAAWDEKILADEKIYIVYAASKTEGERQAWRWFEEKKPNFVLNTVLPNCNFGKILMPEIPGSTMNSVRKILQGDSSVIGLFPPQYFVNITDTARLHVIALLDPAVKSERIFAFGAEYNWTDILGILRKLRPNNTNIPPPPENEGRDLTEIIPQKRAEQLLLAFSGQSGWTGLEESIAAGIKDLE